MTTQTIDKAQKDCDMRNRETSKKEIADFISNLPEKYFLYVKETGTHYGASGIAITWMGEKLGDIQFGKTWRGNMGDERVSLRCYAINGCTYAGTYFKSAGQYARIKKVKN